jgi:antitoxin (DNA-binding transcriptional repressor) of toxin-antitoxin stability system
MLDIDVKMVNYIVMKEYEIEKANIAQVKESLSAYVAMAEQGKTVVVCRRNKPVAELVAIQPPLQPNRTRLGSARGSVVVKCDLTVPAMDDDEWEALR